jgi:hypothetical protein
MRKNIRRVVDKYYDVYKPDDYEPGMDNLNPKREVEFDLKYEEILSTIKGRIEKQYKLAGLEYGDEEVPEPVLVCIVVQFTALKLTVTMRGQFQKACCPMLVTPSPMVSDGT